MSILKSYVEFVNESKEWIYEGDFNVTQMHFEYGRLIKERIPSVINGSFYCEGKKLTTLEGSPKVIVGDFYVTDNDLKSLVGGPTAVEGNYYCNNNELETLEGAPEKVNGFYCNLNHLSSLIGSPKIVSGEFVCKHNLLTSLEGCPEKIGSSFWCKYNSLTSLEGGPKFIGGRCAVNHNLANLKVESDFIKSGSYKEDYWLDLLKYCIDNKIDLNKVENWPKGFITNDLLKSVKSISKYNI